MDLDIKAAFREAKDLNGLSLSDLAYLTDEKPKTVESWLYEEGREPTWKACFLLFEALRKSRGRVPRDLVRHVQRDTSRVTRWARKNHFGGSVEYVGEKMLKRSGAKYVFRGELLEISEIADAMGKSYWQIYPVARGLQPGADITDALDNRRFNNV